MRFWTTLSLSAVLTAGLVAQAPAPPPAVPPPPALLGFTVTGSTTIGSQYIFRRLTQTDGKPTVQAELDLVHPSGFYVSTSLSNISWFTDQNARLASAPVSLGSSGAVGPPFYLAGRVNSAGVELDLFGGYKWGFAKDWTLDVGLYRYFYPGTYDNLGAFRNPDTTEAYLGLDYSWASLKYSRVTSENCMGVNHSRGATYLDFSLGVPLGESGWTLPLHADAGGDRRQYQGTGGRRRRPCLRERHGAKHRQEPGDLHHRQGLLGSDTQAISHPRGGEQSPPARPIDQLF